MLGVVALTWASTARAQDMALSTVLIEGEDWQLVAAGYKFTEAPAVDRDGSVYFVDVPDSLILKIGVDGKPVVWARDTGKTSGLMFGPEGRLYACQSGVKQVVWYDRDAKPTVLATGIAGEVRRPRLRHGLRHQQRPSVQAHAQDQGNATLSLANCGGFQVDNGSNAVIKHPKSAETPDVLRVVALTAKCFIF